MINFSSTSTSNRTSRCRRGRRGCMIGVDVLINECPSGRVTCSTRSWQPLEVVYRLLRRSLEGCSWAVNVISTHQSSYPTPVIERSRTNPIEISSTGIRARFIGESLPILHCSNFSYSLEKQKIQQISFTHDPINPLSLCQHCLVRAC